jgi:hypothetical protein
MTPAAQALLIELLKSDNGKLRAQTKAMRARMDAVLLDDSGDCEEEEEEEEEEEPTLTEDDYGVTFHYS